MGLRCPEWRNRSALPVGIYPSGTRKLREFTRRVNVEAVNSAHFVAGFQMDSDSVYPRAGSLMAPRTKYRAWSPGDRVFLLGGARVGSQNNGSLLCAYGGTAYVIGLNAVGIQVCAQVPSTSRSSTFTGCEFSRRVYISSGASGYDECGNSWGGTLSISGNFFNEQCSANITPVTAAKLVLSAGWGSTAAWTSLSGGDFPIQGTITNSGTGQGASPTITYTFPTPLPVAPYSCTAVDASGTNPLGTFTTSALTTTGVVFTFSLTPTPGDTEVFQITGCPTP